MESLLGCVDETGSFEHWLHIPYIDEWLADLCRSFVEDLGGLVQGTSWTHGTVVGGWRADLLKFDPAARL